MDYIKTVEITTEEYRQLIEDLVNARRDALEAQKQTEKEHSDYLKELCRANDLQKKLDAAIEMCNATPLKGE